MDTEFTNIRKRINIVYYTFYVLYILLIVIFGYLLKPADNGRVIDPLSHNGQIISYLVIFYVIASIPGALWWFKRQMKAVSQIADEEEKQQRYTSCALIRVTLIGLGAVFAIVAFYMLGAYQSMMWCAAIAILAQIFCKPSDRKIYLEMNNKNEEDL
jgi:hypothetical protein